MSDAVTNVEIEDVLSSIRRLVSEDGRGVAVSDDIAAEPEEDEDKADKLVLTPSLRVASNADAEPKPEPEPEIAEPEIVEPETDKATAEVSQVEDAVELVFEHHGGFGRDDEDEPAAEMDDTEIAEADTAETVLSMVEETVDAALAGLGVETLAEEAEADHEAPEDEAALESRIAEWEEVVARSADEDDEWEPEAQDVVQEPAVATYAEEIDPEQDFDEAPMGLRIDESVLDEDALRDLVSEIVRQELQGALGERITRNVRKLVRREIHRALAAQDLE